MNSMAVNARRFECFAGTFQGDEYCEYADGGVSCTGALNFLIQHRFGQLNSGAYNFFRPGQCYAALGLDYGITDRLDVGVGRSSFLKDIRRVSEI